MKFLSSLMALIQTFLIWTGVINGMYDKVEYGGTPYVPTQAESYLTIVADGQSDYEIVIPDNAADTVTGAADELQSYIEQMSGVRLEIISDRVTAESDGREIVVGYTSRSCYDGIDKDSQGREGFTLKAAGNTIVIAGSGERGALYGVYTFLEEQLGVRWFTPELTVVPEAETVRVDAKLDDTQIPKLEYRYTDWNSAAYYPEWRLHQKINCDNDTYNSGGVTYAGTGCHSFTETIVSRDVYFAGHPEYFAYRTETRERKNTQLCLSNKDVLDLVIREVGDILAADPSAHLVSLTQYDNQEYCQCENCQRLADQYGGQSGLMVWFVNQVAEYYAVKYPDILFQTFAYQYTRQAPENIVPADNVCIYLCSIECCFCHPLSECGHVRKEGLLESASEKESTFAADIKDWSAISNNLYVWDYTADFNVYLAPFMDFHVLSDNMKFFIDSNVIGVFEEGLPSKACDGEFGALRAYVLSKLLWDPDCDVEYHMTDFMRAYYGEESAEYIKKYIDMFTSQLVKTDHLFIWGWHYEDTFFSLSQCLQLDSMWNKAVEKADTAKHLENIERSRLSYRFYKANLLRSEFSLLNPMRSSENKKLYEDLKSFGVTQLVSGCVCSEKINFLLRPIDWLKKTY